MAQLVFFFFSDSRHPNLCKCPLRTNYGEYNPGTAPWIGSTTREPILETSVASIGLDVRCGPRLRVGLGNCLSSSMLRPNSDASMWPRILNNHTCRIFVVWAPLRHWIMRLSRGTPCVLLSWGDFACRKLYSVTSGCLVSSDRPPGPIYSCRSYRNPSIDCARPVIILNLRHILLARPQLKWTMHPALEH